MKGEKLNICQGSGGYKNHSMGGAYWANHSICPMCEKTVVLTKDGRLRNHGTYRKVESTDNI